MNRSTLALLVIGGLIFSTVFTGQIVKAQGLSFPAEINKSFSPISIPSGGTARLSVTIYNPNVFALTNASWNDNLIGVQPGLSIESPPNVSNTCGGSVTATVGATNFSLSGGTVPAQGAAPGSCTVSVDVTSTTPGNLINTIPARELTSTGGGVQITNTTPASATLRVGIIQAPTLNKSFNPNTTWVGQTSQLTIRIRNNDLNATLTQTSVTDNLPANVVLANPVSSTLTNCGTAASLTAVPGGTSVRLSNSTIPANSTCVIRVNVTSDTAGAYTNTIPARAIQTQQGVTNGSPASARLNVQEVGINKSFSPANFQAGGTSTLTITLQNPSGSPYTGVDISDTLPGTVLTVVPGTATTTCGGTASTAQPRTVSLANGVIPAGTILSPGTCTISVQVTAPANATAASFTNTILENALNTDQGVTNAFPATAPIRIYEVGAGVTANKSFTPATISEGENSLLRINIPAPADTALTNFSLTDNLPPNVTVSNSSPATRGGCGASSVLTAATGATFIRLTNATIPAGTNCQINVYVTSSTTGLHLNLIQPTDITNNENRTVPNNITANLTVEAVSDFSMSKAFTPPIVSPGGISTLTITLRNTSTSPFVDVFVSDSLPGTPTNGVVVASPPNSSTTCTGGVVTAIAGSQTISMTGGAIPAQIQNIPGTCTINVDVRGMGVLTTHTNTIPAANAVGTIQGTNTTISPAQPASANLRIVNLAIGIVKGFDPLTVFGGSASTLSIELVNPNNVQLTGIAFADNMPAGMIIANPVNPSVGTCGGTLTGNPGDDSFSFSGGSLPAATSCTLTIRVTITVNGNLTNSLAAHAVTTANGASNPDPADASLTNLPGASVSKFFLTNPITAGSYSLLTITIQNTGGVPLSGMGLIDSLPGAAPAGLEVAASPSAVNNCGGTLSAIAGSHDIELTNGVLAANSSCTIVVSVTGSVAGSYTNTIPSGRLRSNEGGTNVGSAEDTLIVTGNAVGAGGSGRGSGNSGGSSSLSTPSAAGSFLIPVTGFAPNLYTKLDDTTRPAYDVTGLRMEIPVIQVNTPIVGVELKNGGWDVSWLQDQAGWLNGTAYPTWKGNSVITAHVVNADGKPGLFSRLKYLDLGEYIFVYSSGYRYTYKVVSSELLQPDDVNVLKHEDTPHLTLITCDHYDEQSGTYLKRVVVRAQLVDVRLWK